MKPQIYNAMIWIAVTACTGAPACSDAQGENEKGEGPDLETDSDDGNLHSTDSGQVGPDNTDQAGRRVNDKVYAHSADMLFAVKPETLELTEVGPFAWPSEPDQMTDIAVDANGNMVGVSFDRVYSIDKETAVCTLLSEFSGGSFNGLGFVEGVGDDGGATLIGAAQDGGWYAIDPRTGDVELVGSYGGSMGSSGDVVYIRDGGTFATVNHPNFATDVLVSVDPDGGAATVIGETGFDGIWGIAYWDGQVFGFTQSGQFLLIDIATGQGTLVETSDVSFWGAGVTTLAKVPVV